MNTALLVLALFAAKSLGDSSSVCEKTCQYSLTGCCGKEKTYLFALGGDFAPYDYFELQKLKGFTMDLVNKVCAMANKDCRVVYDPYENCWKSVVGERARIGEGLVDRWYDGCLGWFITYERLNSVSFSAPWTTTEPNGAFYVKAGTTDFDPKDITNKTIGFLDGWYINEFCLARQPDIVGADKLTERGAPVKFYLENEKLLEAVENGDVDAVFIPVLDSLTQGLVNVGDDILNCAAGGQAAMFRKDSTVNEWWKPAFDKLRESGQLKELCDAAEGDHGTPVNCL